MDALSELFSTVQQWLFEALVQPAMFSLGMGNLLEDGYTATGWLLVGLLQIAVLVAVFGPLQRWRPVEPVTDRQTIRTDILYTLIHRLGLFRVAMFLTLEPLFDDLFGALRVAGWHTWHLDELWPGVTDQALVSLLIYLVAFDLVDYWLHRAQHHFHWWWQLHALHHAQRQMTMWSDNRNHLLDDLLRDCLIVVLAQGIGVAPGQFVAIVAFTQLSESLQHTNLRLWFGPVGERLWISPRFHRLHHSVGLGHESAGKGTLGGFNFGVLLPWWDMLFGTANFELRYDPTGVRDQVEQGRDYGRGFWAQQLLGLKRLLGRA
ncbi:sterol desaturase family protein [Ramlibacter sp. 2FC]|uniref:sterol desaturase family protein n=1 Tax=Ramlibacter sp. 2FC TaxID=2502188 RepID=UPI00201E61F8|nr:sterol desaturase family protein [Ramlibacter sp. 2FC]